MPKSKVGKRQADYNAMLDATHSYQCEQHKNYQGTNSPTVLCAGCWQVYFEALSGDYMLVQTLEL